MTYLSLMYGHVSTNIGDLALNAGLVRLMENLKTTPAMITVLPPARDALIEQSVNTHNAKWVQHTTMGERLPDLQVLQRYCRDPESFFVDLGIADVDTVVLHSGEHLYAPDSLRSIHKMAPWRLLPVLAAKVTGRRAIILPSTLGPFGKDRVSEVIQGVLKSADAVACREPVSAQVAQSQFGIKLPTLLDPAFFLTSQTHQHSSASDLPPRIGVAMRLEDFGLRAGSIASTHTMEQATSSGFKGSIAYQFAQELISIFHANQPGTQFVFYVQAKSDEELQKAIVSDALATYPNVSVTLEYCESIEGYQESLSGLDMMIGARFHGCILALARNTPAIGIHMRSHGHKMLGLFEGMGIPNYAITLDEQSAAQSATHVYNLFKNREHHYEKVWRTLEKQRRNTESWLHNELVSKPSIEKQVIAQATLTQLAELGLILSSEANLVAYESPQLSQNPSIDTSSPNFKLRESLANRPLAPFPLIAGGDRKGQDPFKSFEETRTLGWKDRNFDRIPLVPPIAWEQVTTSNRGWTYHLQSWEFLGPAFRAFDASGDSKYLLWAIDIIADWARTYPRIDWSQDFPWYDMSIGWRTHRLAYLIDAVAHTDIPQCYFDSLVDTLNLHLEAIGDDRCFKPHSNHGFFVATAQLSMATRLSTLLQSLTHLELGRNRIATMLESQFTSDGVHLEHSPDYHQMMLGTLAELLEIDAPSTSQFKDFLSKSHSVLAWFITPGGNIAMLGDSPRRSLLGRSPDSIHSPHLLLMTSDGSQGFAPQGNFRAFLDAGYFVVKHGWPGDADSTQMSQLIQTAGFHSRSHKQADDLSFIWYENGQEILADAGRYGYLDRVSTDSDLGRQGFYYGHPARVYVESTTAHNTVEIDGKSYQRRGVKPFGSALLQAGETDGVFYSGCHVRQFTSIRHARVLAYHPGHWLLVYDWLFDNKNAEHDFIQRFHFGPQAQVFRDQSGYLAHVGERVTVRVTPLIPKNALDVVKGQKDPMLGWISERDNELTPVPSVGFYEQGVSSTVFATLFTLGMDTPTAPQVNVAPSGQTASIQWTLADQVWALQFRRPDMEDFTFKVSSTAPLPAE